MSDLTVLACVVGAILIVLIVVAMAMLIADLTEHGGGTCDE